MEEDKRASFIKTDWDTRRILPPDLNSYIIGCKLGSAGSFGKSTLWLTKCVNDDEECLYVARKTAIDKLTTKDLKNMQDEMQVSSFLNHPCILFSYTSFVVNNGYIWSIFPLFNYGSCHDLISAEFHNGMPNQLVTMILRSVLLALDYLHKMGFIHRAVKGSHILLNSDGTTCLSGLRYCLPLDDVNGCAHCFPHNAMPLFPWLAPEILQQDLLGYNDRADIYSLGITAVELVTGTIPFNKLRPTEVLLQKIRGVVPELPDEAIIEELHCDNVSSSQLSLEGLDQTNDMMFSPPSGSFPGPCKRIRNLQQFVDACLQSDPKSRPSASQLKDSPYIRHIKRKMKERDCLSYVELLKPLSPIKEFRENTSDSLHDDAFMGEQTMISPNESYWIF